MMSTYPQFVSSKFEKEQFVTGHHGTSWLEVHNVIFFYIFNILALKALQKYVPFFVLEPICLILLPCLAILHPWLAIPWITVPVTIGLILLAPSLPEKSNKKDRHPESITTFRGILILLTSFSIMAVDFQVFPRRFAKTELYGTSLMDIGVGLFVFMQGLIHGFRDKPRRFRWSILALGLVRLILVKSMDYQEHVTEYGLHWNFFFTLATIEWFDNLLAKTCNGFEEILGFFLVVGHQSLLTFGGLSTYIQTAPRDTFFSMNREGILSLPGYFAISLFARSLGKHFNLVALLRLGLGSILSGTLLAHYLEPVSRRLANAAFVCWITGSICFFLFLLKVAEKKIQIRTLILDQASKNMLPVFLLGNVCTGLINLFLDTLQVTNLTAHLVLAVYMAVVIGTGVLYNRNSKGSSLSDSLKRETK